MKRKRGIASFLSPKRIESEAEQQGSDKVNDQGHEEVEGDEEQQQESVSDEIEGKDEQGQEEEGEHNREEETEEGEDHIDKVQEGESERQQDGMQSSDSEGERNIPKPLQPTASRVGPHDISKSRCEEPAQPTRESFPKTLQGGARRSFRTDWYKTHSWLEYSQSNDSAYCFPCRHFSLPDAPKTVFISIDGYRNWKKATMKDSGFCSHARSESHVNTMFAWGENKKLN
ncbi:zinc finger and BTB domain-containing protein 47-like [Gymnodraco acuticeps]|uniref:Zinc finger and BTB domain-containing protein 47-like n=1 Tax=Gymnodraco acuticeps TaxID=8218 RepID=A0A6P8TK53_GYMAC|nr:zinc finger and BTB domain-containing protein 47-like [Gymnodraco acuticeps]